MPSAGYTVYGIDIHSILLREVVVVEGCSTGLGEGGLTGLWMAVRLLNSLPTFTPNQEDITI